MQLQGPQRVACLLRRRRRWWLACLRSLAIAGSFDHFLRDKDCHLVGRDGVDHRRFLEFGSDLVGDFRGFGQRGRSAVDLAGLAAAQMDVEVCCGGDLGAVGSIGGVHLLRHLSLLVTQERVNPTDVVCNTY